ncbi:response regulator [Microcoleus sp. herbarium12]|jgi:CheY-like chemotaxis protein|uniref:response regulator n=1 Tax=Microcoleus sp. herbarium12 TaxID=3055437 RepID=UPI002FCF2DD1
MSKPVILCVDDEPDILNTLKMQLKNEFKDNYFYELAESADEALDLIEDFQPETEVIVVVSDWLMPGIKGDELFMIVHKKYPQIIKVMLTGQADEAAVQRAFKEADLYCCLYKPWQSKDLIETIKSGLAKLL